MGCVGAVRLRSRTGRRWAQHQSGRQTPPSRRLASPIRYEGLLSLQRPATDRQHSGFSVFFPSIDAVRFPPYFRLGESLVIIGPGRSSPGPMPFEILLCSIWQYRYAHATFPRRPSPTKPVTGLALGDGVGPGPSCRCRYSVPAPVGGSAPKLDPLSQCRRQCYQAMSASRCIQCARGQPHCEVIAAVFGVRGNIRISRFLLPSLCFSGLASGTLLL
jgi:hypothetical protein